MKKIKRLLIPIVALLVFSTLSTSVSAPVTDYYWISFYGEAEGWCAVSTKPPGGPTTGPPFGKGTVQVRGSAIARETTPPWYNARATYPNTRLWTRRTCMTASWNNSKLTVWMWPSYTFYGSFRPDMDLLGLANMSFLGYYKGEAGLQFVRGTAEIHYGDIGPVSYLQVTLFVGTEHWLSFSWGDKEHPDIPPEYVARHVTRSVAVWGPIPWGIPADP